MKITNQILFFGLIILCLTLLISDLVYGSFHISFSDLFEVLRGEYHDEVIHDIVLNYRLPKALTAVLSGASLSVAGLLMQTMFRNYLADPYILGVSSGSSLGVAVVTMASGTITLSTDYGIWLPVIAAIFGGSVVLLLVISVSFRVKNANTLLIVGLMFGTIASSIVSILQNFSSSGEIKQYITWTFGSLTQVTWSFMAWMFPLIIIGIGIAFIIQKQLDCLLLGENYAKGLGVSIIRVRTLIVLSTGILAGVVTAFVGPIAFLGITIPYIARHIFKTSSHKILIPATILCGANLLLICDLISQMPSIALPLNTITALFGAPVIIWILMKGK